MPAVSYLKRRVLGPEGQDLRTLRVRVQVSLTLLLIATNVIGVSVLVALNLLIIPGGGPSKQVWIALAIAVPSYVAIAVVAGTVIITRSTLKRLRWALQGQTPTRSQRRDALRMPWRITRVQFGLWLIGAALFSILAVFLQPEAAFPMAAGIIISGLVTGAVSYLLSEFALRPVAARALMDHSGDIVVAGVRRRMVVFWLIGTGAPALGLILASIVALTDSTVVLSRFAWAIIALALAVLVFGFLVTMLNSGAVKQPIESVRQALSDVQNGNFDARVEVDDSTELGLLQAGFNDMAAGLREREKIRDLFGRHVGESVATVATHTEVELGGQTVEASVLMIDLISSTRYAADRPASEVVDMLNRFFTVIVEDVERHNGLVNKFMGDAVLAIFGAPVDLESHATAALASARSIMSRLVVEVPEIGAGIGVSTGEVVAGNVGAASRFEYTVIGDAVNAASRLTELSKQVPGHVLATVNAVGSAYDSEQRHWQMHESVTLRGRPRPTDLYRLADPSA